MVKIVFDVILLMMLILAIGAFVYSWKKNVLPINYKENSDKFEFYEEDEKHLDIQIMNHPWYYSKEEFEKIKAEVLSKQFPI